MRASTMNRAVSRSWHAALLIVVLLAPGSSYAQGSAQCMQRTYSIASIDERFHLASSTLSKALLDAEAVWENPLHKDIFSKSEHGQLQLSFVYDARQESMMSLKNQETKLDAIKQVLSVLQTSHKQASLDLQREVDQNKVAFDAYAHDMDIFNADVARVNASGGATSAQYTEFGTRKDALQTRFDTLKSKEIELNGKITTLNTIASLLNQVVAALNAFVERLNASAQKTGEFEEGVYSRKGGSETIVIYAYTDTSQLARLLAHELGHALGLGHVSDPEAIMYKVNKGTRLSTTAADLAEYEQVCGK